MVAMATPSKPPTDPWASFPGGNPFGPGGPFGGGGDPFQNLDAWLRNMGVDPADFRKMADEMSRAMQDALRQMDPANPNKSFVSGFNIKVGPDGKPTFNTFGNKPSVQPMSPGAKGPGI